MIKEKLQHLMKAMEEQTESRKLTAVCDAIVLKAMQELLAELPEDTIDERPIKGLLMPPPDRRLN